MLSIVLSLASCSKSADKEAKELPADEKTEEPQPETIQAPENESEAIPAEEEAEAGEQPSEEIAPEADETAEADEIEGAATTRPSEVEFYLLFKRSSFVKRTIAEEQTRTYGMEGNESTAASQDFTITVTPLIITRDSVKFKINNYTTKALMEHESDGTSEFEIFVNNIYYRP